VVSTPYGILASLELRWPPVLVALSLLACRGPTTSQAPVPFITDIITSRAPFDGVPAMLVGTPSPNSCTSAEVTLAPAPPVFTSAGALVDTSTFIVGRQVSVWASIVEEPCVERAHADKVVVYIQ